MTWAAVAVGGGTALGGYLASRNKGGGSDISQIPLETPEQSAARRGLLDFARTGRFGN